MIDIIAHRGFWEKTAEKNTLEAFKRAIDHGFGIETDFRDRHEKLYIAHDVVEQNPIEADIFFELTQNTPLPIALNIKSDGLQKQIESQVKKHNINNYFIFDASIPDLLLYSKQELKCYSRISEYETFSLLDTHTTGFWIDYFHGTDIQKDFFQSLLSKNKSLCFVSPELHKREYLQFWKKLKNLLDKTDLSAGQKIQICTDYPLKLQRFLYNGSN